jgi:hypothetical protein
MTISKSTTKPSITDLLILFGYELKALAQRQESKSRRQAYIDINVAVAAFMRDHAEMVSQVKGPDLEKLFVVTGRVHVDDDDSFHIIEGDNPEGRFAHELLGFDPDTAEDIPEDEETTYYINSCGSLQASIDARLKPLTDDGAGEPVPESVTAEPAGGEAYSAVALCISHMTLEDRNALMEAADDPDENMVMGRDTGIFIKLYAEADGDEGPFNLRHGHSEDLKRIIRWAVASGFQLIEFDSAAPEIEGFPVFDW